MKKILSLMVVFVLMLSLCACFDLEINGLSEFNPYICDFELTLGLFPLDNYISRFEYIEGDFHFFETDILQGYVETIAYFKYSPDIYEEAKSFCMDSFPFCENHQYEYNGFVFLEHTLYSSGTSRQGLCCYPEWFNIFAYNDDTCTLVFLGYHNDDKYSDRVYAETDFPKFLEITYSEYFDFDA